VHTPNIPTCYRISNLKLRVVRSSSPTHISSTANYQYLNRFWKILMRFVFDPFSKSTLKGKYSVIFASSMHDTMSKWLLRMSYRHTTRLFYIFCLRKAVAISSFLWFIAYWFLYSHYQCNVRTIQLTQPWHNDLFSKVLVPRYCIYNWTGSKGRYFITEIWHNPVRSLRNCWHFQKPNIFPIFVV
jgi:hypothetical protein